MADNYQSSAFQTSFTTAEREHIADLQYRLDDWGQALATSEAKVIEWSSWITRYGETAEANEKLATWTRDRDAQKKKVLEIKLEFDTYLGALEQKYQGTNLTAQLLQYKAQANSAVKQEAPGLLATYWPYLVGLLALIIAIIIYMRFR